MTHTKYQIDTWKSAGLYMAISLFCDYILLRIMHANFLHAFLTIGIAAAAGAYLVRRICVIDDRTAFVTWAFAFAFLLSLMPRSALRIPFSFVEYVLIAILSIPFVYVSWGAKKDASDTIPVPAMPPPVTVSVQSAYSTGRQYFKQLPVQKRYSLIVTIFGIALGILYTWAIISIDRNTCSSPVSCGLLTSFFNIPALLLNNLLPFNNLYILNGVIFGAINILMARYSTPLKQAVFNILLCLSLTVPFWYFYFAVNFRGG